MAGTRYKNGIKIGSDADSDIYLFTGSGAPTDGAAGTGAGEAGKGSLYFRRSNGALYYNSNTKASPTWTLIGTVAAGSITNTEIDAAAAIARSKLAEDALTPHRIPLASVLGADGADLAITETAGDFYRSIGTNQLLILGEVSNGTVGADVEASVGWFEFQLPENYVAGGDIKIRAGVDVVGAGALGTCTIDFSAYLQNGLTGAVGSDLVTTGATAISKTEANKDFTVDATGLVAGDLLVIKMTTSVDNTDSTAIQAQISRLDVLCDVQG